MYLKHRAISPSDNHAPNKYIPLLRFSRPLPFVISSQHQHVYKERIKTQYTAQHREKNSKLPSANLRQSPPCLSVDTAVIARVRAQRHDDFFWNEVNDLSHGRDVHSTPKRKQRQKELRVCILSFLVIYLSVFCHSTEPERVVLMQPPPVRWVTSPPTVNTILRKRKKPGVGM